MEFSEPAVVWEKVTRANPLVQCITNTVSHAIAANTLLAVGASPAMLDHEADSADFAAIADALLVNFGTASSHQFLAADAAISTCAELGKPWVLDPVSYGAAKYRSSRIRQALAQHPTVIRGNASEIAALAGAGAGAKGVDAVDEVDQVIPAGIELAKQTGSIVAISGIQDAIISAGEEVRVARISGGAEMMPLVVAIGCSLGAVTAAYLAAHDDPFAATVAAHVHFAHAGQRAAQTAKGPGTFAAGFLDELYLTTASDLSAIPVEIR